MPQPQYILPPFDPSAMPSVSGPQLLQYLSGARNTSVSGFNIWTEDIGDAPQVPDAVTYPELQRFAWIRQRTGSVSGYLWNENGSSDATYLKWVAFNISGIAAGSIVGSMIADNTIPDSKIIGVDWSKIIGAPANLPPSGDAGGDLDGTYPDPVIGNEKVTEGKIADGAVTEDKIGDEEVTFEKLAPNAVGLTLLRTNAGASAVEWFVPQLITLLVDPAGGGDANKVVKVNGAGDGFELATVATSVVAKFTTSGHAITNDASQIFDVAHGLAGVPTVLYCRLVCTSADQGYSVGDEVNIDSLSVTAIDSDNEGPSFALGCNATNVFMSMAAHPVVAPRIVAEDGSASDPIDITKWTAKCTALYFP